MSSEKSLSFAVGEMSCGSCVGRVEKALKEVPGVETTNVNLAAETATVTVDDSFQTTALTAALDAAGYPASVSTYRMAIENMSWVQQLPQLNL